MPTINQLIASPRVVQKSRKKVPALQQSRRSVVSARGLHTTPKKPNSALRKVAKCALTNGSKSSLLPGEGHTFRNIPWS